MIGPNSCWYCKNLGEEATVHQPWCPDANHSDKAYMRKLTADEILAAVKENCEAGAQPDPVKNDLPAVWDLVFKDMGDRDYTGLRRYGTRLQPHNGRDAIRDAYEEALDLCAYLRQAIYERDGK